MQTFQEPRAVIPPAILIMRVDKIADCLPLMFLDCLEQVRGVQLDLPLRLPKEREPHGPDRGDNQAGVKSIPKIHLRTFAGTIELASDSD
jgi:hypothetical protein